MQKPRYWFQAASNGQGWSWPLAWQGWVVYALVAVLLPTGFLLFPPTTNPLAFAGFHACVALSMLLVCWLKGEPLAR